MRGTYYKIVLTFQSDSYDEDPDPDGIPDPNGILDPDGMPDPDENIGGILDPDGIPDPDPDENIGGILDPDGGLNVKFTQELHLWKTDSTGFKHSISFSIYISFVILWSIKLLLTGGGEPEGRALSS